MHPLTRVVPIGGSGQWLGRQNWDIQSRLGSKNWSEMLTADPCGGHISGVSKIGTPRIDSLLFEHMGVGMAGFF